MILISILKQFLVDTNGLLLSKAMDDRTGLEDLNSPPIHSGLTVCTAEVLSRLDFTTVFKGWPIPRSRKYLKKRK